MPPDSSPLAAITTLVRAGRLEQAVHRCRAWLRRHGGDRAVWNLLGLIQHRREDWAAARQALGRARELGETGPVTAFLLGLAHLRLGETSQAEALFRTTARLDPRHHEAPHHLARLAMDREDWAAAAHWWRMALERCPGQALYHDHYGLVLQRLGRPGAALVFHRQAVALAPERPAGYIHLGRLLTAQGETASAIRVLRQGLEQNPDTAADFFNLGLAFRGLGQPREEELCYREALALAPTLSEAHNNLGVLALEQGRLEAAAAAFRRAIDHHPGNAEAHNSLGVALWELGRLEEGLAAVDRALALRPDFAEAHCNRAQIHLARGDYTRGWPEYAWRWQRPGYPRPAQSAPPWRGESLAGRSLLFVPEQGFGDTLQFLRFLPLLQARGATVLAQVPQPLARLVAGLGVNLVPPGTAMAGCDYHVSTFDLPVPLGLSLADLPGPMPYLHVPPEAVPPWRQRRVGPHRQVGLVWAGKASHRNDWNRSLDPAALAPLFEVPGVCFHSLQKDLDPALAHALSARGTLDHWGPDLDDFFTTACALMALDLVISVDTAVAHLAGALGRPTWVLIPANADWRWLADDRTTSPWYPSLRLFRQQRAGDWEPALRALALALGGLS
ncbi:MAG: tetratricopeptide repeat protein [Magnetococcales bacterium]|nr:tetratricopeptide repeat protein [Magnetococcales bacterium]